MMKSSITQLLWSCISVLLLYTSGFSQSVQTSQRLQPIQQQIDALILHTMNTYTIPGLSIGIVREDTIVYNKGYGITHIHNDNPVTENTVFHTASISKLVTAQAIIKLTTMHPVDLDDRIVDIIPEVHSKDQRFQKITLRSLLNHTSGLEDINNYHWNNAHQGIESLQNYILSENFKLRSAPLTEYYYSNLGYDLLGYIIEKVTQQPFEDYVQMHLLEPMDMLPSDFRYFKIPKELRAYPHSKRPFIGKIYTRNTYPYTREQAPSNTLNASTKALSNWMCDFLKEINTIDTSIYASMIKPSILEQDHIGLGFQLYNLYGQKAIGHFGGDKGSRSFLLMFPKQHIGIVLLANCDYDEDFRQEIVFPIAKLLLDEG